MSLFKRLKKRARELKDEEEALKRYNKSLDEIVRKVKDTEQLLHLKKMVPSHVPYKLHPEYRGLIFENGLEVLVNYTTQGDIQVKTQFGDFFVTRDERITFGACHTPSAIVKMAKVAEQFMPVFLAYIRFKGQMNGFLVTLAEKRPKYWIYKQNYLHVMWAWRNLPKDLRRLLWIHVFEKGGKK